MSAARERSPGPPLAPEADNPRPPLLVIGGPTASGKTEMAIQLALQLGGEVVTADSMQVYRGLDIGTAKPTAAERRGVPHHGIDLVDPDERFSVADFQSLASSCIPEIWRRGRLPILAGGTGLYIRAVISGYRFDPRASDLSARARLLREAEELGGAVLHARLARIDPAASVLIEPGDVRRIVRALEIYEATGQPPSVHLRHLGQSPYRVRFFGLHVERAALYRRIDRRTEDQVRRGLVEEVAGLLARGYRRDLPSLQGLGYREIGRHLAGECTLLEAVAETQRNTRRLAKRQWTWFRGEERRAGLTWLDVTTAADFQAALAAISLVGRRDLLDSGE